MDYRQGRWQRLPLNPYGRESAPVHRPAPSGVPLVRQRITIEPMDRDEVFCVWPFFTDRDQPDLEYDERNERLRRASSLDRFTYELLTTAFARGAQSEITPSDGPVRAPWLLAMPPADRVAGLSRLASQWGREAQSRDRSGLARALQRQLRDSGRFRYSLEGPARDLALDPIEDFVTNHPQGHCEYFATALVLMLRSQQIPARLVIGYRTDEYDRLGHCYQVRQLHAHAWVEAYLRPGDVPAKLIDPRPELWRHGAWLRLDPTPADSTPEPSGLLARTRSWIDRAWNNYVMEMDRPRQREAIYRPLVEWVKQTAQRLTDPAWWRGLLADVLRAIDPRQWGAAWPGWRGGAVALLALLLLTLGYRMIRRVRGRWVARRTRDRRALRLEWAKVAFYRRLEAAMARLGLVRAACQTQREFAREAGAKLAAATGQADLADLIARVAEAFYQVRFGRRPLDPLQSQAVETALAALEQTCRGKRENVRGSV